MLPIDQYIVDKLQKKLDKLDPIFKDQEHDAVKVATIQIAYQNRSVITALTERGRVLKGAPPDTLLGRLKADFGVRSSSAEGNEEEELNRKLEQLKNVEECLNTNIKNNLAQISVPIKAYITFSQQEAVERCAYYLYNVNPDGKKNPNKVDFKLLGDQLVIEQAPEPTDIIWENLEIGKLDMFIAKVRYFVIHFIILFFSLILFTFLKSQKDTITRKYKEGLDCTSINNLFGGGSELVKNKQFYERYRKAAIYDEIDTLLGHGLGFYQCFCNTFSQHSKAFKQIQHAGEDYAKSCDRYVLDTNEVRFLFGPGISIALVLVTFFLQ